ncbi:MAG: PaaI family thioesterase [Streptomycetales bacterium]
MSSPASRSAVRSSTLTPPPEATVPDPHPEAPPPGSQLGSHYHRCFGCGDDHDTGLHMHVAAGEGLTIHARFTVTEDHQGAPGLAHGGLLSCAFDEALGSINWLLRTPSVTGRLETEFRRPVPVGTTLYITGRCDGVSGRKIFLSAEGRLDDPEGPVAVRAAALFITVDVAHFVQHGRAEDIKAAVEHDATRHVVRTFEVNP